MEAVGCLEVGVLGAAEGVVAREGADLVWGKGEARLEVAGCLVLGGLGGLGLEGGQEVVALGAAGCLVAGDLGWAAAGLEGEGLEGAEKVAA